LNFILEEEENRTANANLVALLKPPLMDRNPVDKGAVKAVEIADMYVTGFPPKEAMLPGDERVLDAKVIERCAADREISISHSDYGPSQGTVNCNESCVHDKRLPARFISWTQSSQIGQIHQVVARASRPWEVRITPLRSVTYIYENDY